MKTFTIDADNNITAFPTPDHAEAAVAAGAQPFTSQKELAALAAQWPAERLVAIWNSLPGVKPVESFKNGKAAAGKIWERVQGLGEPANGGHPRRHGEQRLEKTPAILTHAGQIDRELAQRASLDVLAPCR